MRTRLTIALAAMMLAGCTGPDAEAAPTAPLSPPSVAASPSPSPQSAREEFRAALKRLGTSTYRFTMTGDYWDKQKIKLSGAVDPRARKQTRTTVITGGPDAKTVRRS
ncbi:hypothetical protein ACQPZJ_16365 [Actinoplanes sp. CA-054009]